VERQPAGHTSRSLQSDSASSEVTATDFDALVAAHRDELFVHCYRMLGSVEDAEDALQEALVAAWRGLSGFAGRSSLRTWLYRVTTNVCLRLITRRPRRILSEEHMPPLHTTDDLGSPVRSVLWLEPLPDSFVSADATLSDPSARLEKRETIELAYVAALQHLPGKQRAALILSDVFDFSTAEIAQALDTTRASVNSALQRARTTVKQRIPSLTQQTELQRLGDQGQRDLVNAFVGAWERADVAGLVELLVEDARLRMPPLPAWFSGRDDISRFLRERMFATPWRLVRVSANAQLAFACYQGHEDGFRLGAINVVGLRQGRVAELNAFLDPALHRHFGLPEAMNFG
jgi:RNA polymerase sigma-70 factor (ECF subfamily)